MAKKFNRCTMNSSTTLGLVAFGVVEAGAVVYAMANNLNPLATALNAWFPAFIAGTIVIVANTTSCHLKRR